MDTRKEKVRKARITAVVIGLFLIIAQLALVFAFYQRALKEKSEAARLSQESKSAKEIEMITTKLEAALAELDKCRQK